MSATLTKKYCAQSEHVAIYALSALSAKSASQFEAHLPTCNDCRNELEQFRPIVDCLVDWPSDDIKPSARTRQAVARRISGESGREIRLPATRSSDAPEWEQVSPGIWCQLLARDEERKRVSTLVRLAPGVVYPPHTHAGVEELHLLDGELWIDERKLFAGDFNHAEPGTSDQLVWSETGCTCVLVTSLRDTLGCPAGA
jgi:anti-sigma factor ChrR (cupin superfamily)